MDKLKYFMCKLFVLIVCTIFNDATVSVFSSNYFHGVGDVTFLDEQSRSEGKAASRLACVNKCLDCPILTFDVNTKDCNCYFYTNVTMIPSTGGEVWFSDSTTVFLVQRSDSSMMTHSEGALLCEQVQGRLSTTTELFNAWSLGYHMCRCGWVLDTTVRYSVTFDDPSCEQQGSITNSILTCKDAYGNYPNVVQSAYCTKN